MATTGPFPVSPEVPHDGLFCVVNVKIGRDHHKEAFTVWMAGGGTKGGFEYGQTDELGYAAAENPVHMHDFNATILHLLGIDHERLNFRYQGLDVRLTDVHGHVVKDVIA